MSTTEPAREAAPARSRMHAAARRDAILDAALIEFSLGGLHGATTEAIAERAGITQPYLYRFFPSKRALFLASAERCFDRIGERFRAAVHGDTPEERLSAMGEAYVPMLADRSYLLSQMHTYAACSDDEVRETAQRRYGELFALIGELSGATPEAVRAFLAEGMMLNVCAALDLPAIAGEQSWAWTCLGPCAEQLS